MSQVVSSLLIVLAIIAMLRFGLRYLGWTPDVRRRRTLRVVETCALSGRQRLHVVEADGERLLIGASDQGISLLQNLGPEKEEAPPVLEEADSEVRRHWWRDARAWMRSASTVLLALWFLALGADVAYAQAAEAADPGSLTLTLEGATEPDRIASTLEIVALVTFLSVAPSLLLMGTCFTRILIVFSLMRQAIGIAQLPPNQVIVGLALFTTLFVMAPVGEEIHQTALQPYIDRELDETEAIQNAIAPIRAFMLHHTREKDLALFHSLAGGEPPESLDEVSLTALLPAYMISEIRTAFEIGFMIYLPFLILDLVISSMLISMGMIVLPPMIIALPFKLMLFVLLDGWNLVISSLVAGLR